MLPIEQPFKTYTGLDGKPLDNGYVYFGQPGLDPITHPVTVYWDAAGTLPAPQELRTVNGYIMNAGTPANVFHDSAYSVLVKDSKGRQVFYAATSDAFSIATVVSDLLNDLAAPGGAALVQSAAWYAPTIMGFNATKLPDGATVIFSGRAAAADGGGGVFTYAKNSAQVADNGLVFAPAGGGRLLREGWTVLGFNGDLRPRYFGAVGNGIADDTGALQDTITSAFSFGKKQKVDLCGAAYLVSQPLSYPAGSNVTLANGTIKAAAGFDTTRHVLECVSQSGGLVHHDLTFDTLTLDANSRGGCFVIDNYIRVLIINCKFLHFTTQGLWLKKTLDSHEAVVTGCSAFAKLYNEPGYLTPPADSVGFQIDSFDNHFIAPVSYYTGKGMVVNAQYNLILQAHLGGIAYGLHITANAAFNSFHQPYIDSAAVLWENPWHTEIVGAKFLHSTADANFCFVVLKPLAPNLALEGLKIANSSFHNNAGVVVKSIRTDTTAGSFDAGTVDSCYIGDNSFRFALRAYTSFRTKLYQAAAVNWVFNVSDYLPFGAVQQVATTLYVNSVANIGHKVKEIAGNVVAITTSEACTGTVFVEVDVNNGTS